MNLYPISSTIQPDALRIGLTRPRQVITPIQFGCSYSSNVRNNEKAIFETYTPHPVKFFQRGMARLNRFLFFNTRLPIPGILHNEFKFADPQSKSILTDKIPKNAGVILVGAHPDLKDGNLLCELYLQTNQYPACVLINSEIVQKFGSFIHPCLIKIVKPIFSMMGMIPLNRGGRNPHVKKYCIKSISEGKWISVFPEGHVNMGPRVSTMQKGAVDMAIQAAIQSKYKKPIMLVPFAHTWTYRNPAQAEKNLMKCLETLEETLMKKKPGTLQDTYPGGELQDRIFRVGSQVIDYKMEQYGLHKPKDWHTKDFFQKAAYLRTEGLALLEKKYFPDLPLNTNRVEHNRLMKIRSAAWEKLASLPESSRKKSCKWFDDIQCTQELSYLSLFNPKDIQDYGNGKTMDKEALASYLVQLSALMKLSSRPLGERTATVKVLPPIDIRDLAKEYEKLGSQAERDQYTIGLTKELFERPIQAEVNALRQKSVRWK